jgi:excisionase family DNA binding protein
MEFDFVAPKIGSSLTGLSTRTLRRKARHGELPVYRIGRLVRYRRGDLLKLIEPDKKQTRTLRAIR